jgi:hypothetical protein
LQNILFSQIFSQNEEKSPQKKITGIIGRTGPTPLWPLHQITGEKLGDLIRFFSQDFL